MDEAMPGSTLSLAATGREGGSGMPFENSPPSATATTSAFEAASPAVATADNWSGAVGGRSLYADLFDKDEAAARIAASGTIYDEALQRCSR